MRVLVTNDVVIDSSWLTSPSNADDESVLAALRHAFEGFDDVAIDL